MLKQSAHELQLEPPAPADAAVIWLHGLGADGHDFLPIVPELGLPAEHRIRFIFPHAPVRPVTINNGMRMRAWYDIYSLDKPSPQDVEGIEDAAGIVHRYVQAQRDAGIPPERIILAGFSQGGAIILHTGLRYPDRLAGLLALSTYLPLWDRLQDEARPERTDTPILMCHGAYDPVLPIQLGEFSRDLLQKAGYAVSWHSYPMQHAVHPEEIALIGRWIGERLR